MSKIRYHFSILRTANLPLSSPHKAATTPRRPATPPRPATKCAAPALLLTELAATELPLDAVVVLGADVVNGVLVSTVVVAPLVWLIPAKAVVEAALDEAEVVAEVDAGVVFAEALAIDELYAAHKAVPTEAADMRSLPDVQAAIRQGAARPPMAACLGPHWQASSLRAQPADTIAEVRQGICAACASVER
jgi:hypothetical protein